MISQNTSHTLEGSVEKKLKRKVVQFISVAILIDGDHI